ncbi:unnamed protein product [Phytophthora fragariaefolia]|uniref:Unnamed protein product n=1 Tax=Phytophthora fragariaefolia TaxID=1490495 RepID=A0A9W6WP01_9STRA|nr:unnamed protein product [Phytophthora fragariaefolia]
MRSESEWMMMFAPVAMAQVKWSALGPELAQSVNSTDINPLVEDTVLLLMAMGFPCNGRPNSLNWATGRSAELELSYSTEFPRLESDPSRVPLPKTPETKKGKKEVFRATKGTPYYEDSHMQTPKTLKGRSGRYAEFYDAADEAELGGNDSDDGQDYRDSAEDSAKDVIRRLSLDDAERDRGHYLEVRYYASLDKIAEFEGKRYRSDDSLQWLKGFINEIYCGCTSEDEEEDGMECQPSRRLSQYDYDDDESDYGREAYSDSEGSSDHDYIDAGLVDEMSRGRNAREDSTRCQKNSTRTQWSSARPLGAPEIPLAELTGSRTAEIIMDAGVTRANDPNMDRVQRVAARGTQCTSVASAANFASKRPPGPLHAEQFKLGGPPTLTGLDEAGLPQSAEPVAEAKYIYAYVGEAGRPERVWTDGNDGSKMDGIDGELDYSKEESRAMITIHKDLLRKERQLYDEWMERQPPAVELRAYSPPTKIARRPPGKAGNADGENYGQAVKLVSGPEAVTRGRPEADNRSRRGENSADAVSEPREMTAALHRVLETSDGLDEPLVSLTQDEDGSGRALNSAVNSAESVEGDPAAPRLEKRGSPPDRGRQTKEINVRDDMLDVDPEQNLHLRYFLATELEHHEGGEGELGRHDYAYERVPNSLALEDYAHELAFLPDLTDVIPTQLDYSADNVVCSAHSDEQTTRLIGVLQSHEQIMISRGNALPPPAYGVVCDIDVQGHPPIRQRARRVPLKHLKKLLGLVKALLKAVLIAFSNSPWATPIGIVLKKNGVDICLCIDYKLVNAITLMMEYAMPLVDDLLTELDASAGLGFVCALGHFEWLRMPFGLKNAPIIYQRLIDNALLGYVQPKGGWEAFAERIRRVEIDAEDQRGRFSTYAEFEPTRLTKFDAGRRALAESDPMQDFIDSPAADMFNTGEPGQSSWVPVFERRSFVDDICFGGRMFDECLDTLDRLLKRFAKCRIGVSFPKSIFAQPKVDVLSHKVTPEGIQADPKKMAANAELPFPTTKKVSFAVLLSPHHLKVQRVREWDVEFAQLLQASITPAIGLDETLKHLAPPSKNSATVRMDPELLYARVPTDYDGYVLSFDGSAETEKNGGYGSCSWILWKLPSWDIEIAASAHLPSITVTIAEYTGMNNGVVAALQRGVSDLIIVGDSRLAIKQSMGVIACNKDAFKSSWPDTKRYQEIELSVQPARAQSQVPNDTAEVLTELSEARTSDASDIDPLVVQIERRQRISKAQDEELRWADLKAYLKGEFAQLSHRRVHNAGKVADEFVLSEDGLLYLQTKLGERRTRRTRLDAQIGGADNDDRRTDYYWIGLYADVVKHIQSCKDCSTRKSKPHLKGYSPGNVTSDRPFHVVSTDFVIPLPRIRRGNTALLLFQDHFTGFVIAKAMSETGALERKEKARRAIEHNEALSRVAEGAVPRGVELPVESATTEGPPTESETPEVPSAESLAESTRSLFKEGDQTRVVIGFILSRLKAVKGLGERPTTRLRPELGETERLDFDEQVLPEASLEPDEDENKYEVEAILDDDLPLSTSTARAQRRFKVKWVGYDEPSWEPLSNLSCGGLLFDYLRNKKRENRLQMVTGGSEREIVDVTSPETCVVGMASRVGPGTEVEIPTDHVAGKATAAELVTEAVITAEFDAGMDIAVELAVDEVTKDELDDGSGVRAELRSGAEATTGPTDEGAGVTTPDVGKGDKSKIDVDTPSPAELANPMVEVVEHDADDPAAEDATGSDVGILESAEADSAEHELMLTSTAELDAVAPELEVAVRIDESWGAEQDTTAESTVDAAETTVVTVVLEVAVTGLEVAATTLDVPVVDTTPVKEVVDTPTSLPKPRPQLQPTQQGRAWQPNLPPNLGRSLVS